MNILKKLIIASAALIACASAAGAAETKAPEKVVVAYVTSWTDEIPDPSLMTHINYAFGHVNDSFNGVRVDNPDRLRSIVALKKQNPALKVLVSVGGWGSGRFSEMAADPKNRKAFANSCKKLVKDFNLDGIDIDWEYPTSSAAGISSSPADTDNFSLLMHDLRKALGKNKILSLATIASGEYIDFPAFIDDVDLDFSKIEKGYINHEGLKGGCRTFVVDLGSWNDESIARGGDMMRLEFLAPTNTSVLKPGLYTVVPQRWNSNELLAGGTYEPMSLNKGYFNGQGLQIGTRYAHNEDGRNWVWDFVAPIESGTVKVDTEDYKTYHFEIKLVDDIGFEVRGEWNKPLEYLYDAENLDKELSGITTPTGAADVKVVLEGRNIVVLNGGNAAITLYDLNGRTVATGNAAEVLDASAFGAGIYVLTINNQSIKIALK